MTIDGTIPIGPSVKIAQKSIPAPLQVIVANVLAHQIVAAVGNIVVMLVKVLIDGGSLHPLMVGGGRATRFSILQVSSHM